MLARIWKFVIFPCRLLIFLNRSGATSTSFVISFPKTVLTRHRLRPTWETGSEANEICMGCVNENESAPNRRMISYIRTVCEGRPQSWISTVRYYPGEEKNQWITSAPIFEDCSLERLQSICRQIDSHLEEEQARGKQYQKLRSIIREEKNAAIAGSPVAVGELFRFCRRFF